MSECIKKKRGRKPKNYKNSNEGIKSTDNNVDFNSTITETSIYNKEELDKDNNTKSFNNEESFKNEEVIKKKRGRKPKIITDEEIKLKDCTNENENEESKELKKRGRKPKCKHPEELLPKVPKKRGRKPKDKYGILVKEVNFNLDQNINQNIILHLPIHSSDLLLNNFEEQNILKYNPEINTPKPYYHNDLYSNGIKHSPYPEILNNKKESNDEDEDRENINNSIENDESIKYDLDNNLDFYNQKDNNDNIVENKDKNDNQGNKEDNFSSDIKEQYNKYNIVSDKKNLNFLLNQNLSYNNSNILNNISSKSKIPKSDNQLLFDQKDNFNLNFRNEIKCWWCCHNFQNYPYALPFKKINDTFLVTGYFCSPECATSWNFNSDKRHNDCLESYSLINILYKRYLDNKIIRIKCAPPRESLSIFGGDLSIEDFRELNKNYNVKVMEIIPPMISVIPQLEEISVNNFQVRKDFIPVDKDRIKKVNNDFKLKRIITNKNDNTLESCMNLKYI